ncbi:hypothetical protein AGABI2DRAFT_123410 [Agaricus bisporus var. bisporus H97]|uniref:hypothetical protein n=1 Tax=Agaricus bisporus var. bisporus (strain H97 / ATCC MYA-4626 / FGSC 10389) TaxID=936046 RepID=UPI00029F6F90|nr:hypothetical protein AGABI2DRAFT_123410 [Agaricus bisporus var. bisporus H97]EKV41691.1 hypothetical protein AGABI2DRAFT_123410 [Agaricus bisporus var. bisporus H97]
MSHKSSSLPSSGHDPSDCHRPSTSSVSTHPTTNFATPAGYPSIPPFLNAQPIPSAQRPPSVHQFQAPDHSLAPQLFQLAQAPCPPYSRPTTSGSYPDTTRLQPIHLLSSPQFIQGSQASAGIPQLGDSIYQSDLGYQPPQSPHPLTQGQLSFSQGPTQYYGQGMFSGSHNFSLEGSTFIDNSSSTADNFMEKLLQHTIIGAEFDSSDRDPPPRCHPGTRLAILQRCLDFIIQCHDEGKLRWVVGPAGVGKSAVMQIVAEKAPDGVIFASVFLSVNGRQDGTKIIMTIAYQLAVKCQPYHRFIRYELTKDPSLMRKALSVQFQKFIVEPFIHQRLFNPPRRFLILIDGLDECSNPRTQQELLELISEFCISNPTSPIAWIVASRPEPHITSFFDDVKVALAYSKEELVVDSDEACEDVQLYLCNELKKIQSRYPTLQRMRQWPFEHEFTKIATAAGGLFAYASTVIRYIDDSDYGDPAAQLNDVLVAIDASPKDDTSGTNGPLAQLDTLYERILSKIPDKVMVNTRKLLLLYLSDRWAGLNFRQQCNMLGLTENTAYGAVRHLHAVAKVPELDEANNENIKYFHKSFRDYLFDFKRSRFSHDVLYEADELMAEISLRVIEEVPDFDGGEGWNSSSFGYLKGGPGACGAISLSWPGDEHSAMTDGELRFRLYRHAIKAIMTKFEYEPFQTLPCFQALTTRFAAPGLYFPFEELRYLAFDKFRLELAEAGKLKQVPLRSLDYAAILGGIDFRFTSPIQTDVELSDPWNPSCTHEKWDEDGSQQKRWSTSFCRKNVKGSGRSPADIPRFSVAAFRRSHLLCLRSYANAAFVRCEYCLEHLARQFINNPNQRATVFVDSTEMCYVELAFVDPDDGVSERKYNFFHSGLPIMY